MYLLSTAVRLIVWAATRPARWARRARGWVRAAVTRGRADAVLAPITVTITADTSRWDAAMANFARDIRRIEHQYGGAA